MIIPSIWINKKNPNHQPDTIYILYYIYPPVIKHGSGQSTIDDFAGFLKPAFSSGIFEPATFDYQRVCTVNIHEPNTQSTELNQMS